MSQPSTRSTGQSLFMVDKDWSKQGSKARKSWTGNVRNLSLYGLPIQQIQHDGGRNIPTKAKPQRQPPRKYGRSCNGKVISDIEALEDSVAKAHIAVTHFGTQQPLREDQPAQQAVARVGMTVSGQWTGEPVLSSQTSNNASGAQSRLSFPLLRVPEASLKSPSFDQRAWEDGTRALQLFHERATPALRCFNSAADWFFTGIVPQLLCQEPAIRHQVVATTLAMDHHFKWSVDTSRTLVVATLYRAHAIRVLSDTCSPPSILVMLTGCLLLITMDVLHRSLRTAVLHLESGLMILRQYKQLKAEEKDFSLSEVDPDHSSVYRAHICSSRKFHCSRRSPQSRIHTITLRTLKLDCPDNS